MLEGSVTLFWGKHLMGTSLLVGHLKSEAKLNLTNTIPTHAQTMETSMYTMADSWIHKEKLNV